MSRTTYITAAAILAALLTPMTGTVHTQEIKAYLKKPNPDELIVAFLHDSRCPGTKDSYQSIIDGELVRARIKEPTKMYRPRANCISSSKPPVYPSSGAVLTRGFSLRFLRHSPWNIRSHARTATSLDLTWTATTPYPSWTTTELMATQSAAPISKLEPPD